jgi:hypothetical protein
MRDKRITDIVVGVIKDDHADWFLGRGFTDIAGNRIHVREDGIAWESTSWVDYVVLDRINEAVEAAGIEAVVEFSNSYEVLVEAL